METLPRDVVEKITKELAVRDFLRFCLGNPQCNNKALWYRRFQRDFPIILKVAVITKENAKEKYLKLIEIISRNAEKTGDNLLEFYGYAGEFLKKTKFRTELISQLYDNYLEIVQKIQNWNQIVLRRDMINEIRTNLKKYVYGNKFDFDEIYDFLYDSGQELFDTIKINYLGKTRTKLVIK